MYQDWADFCKVEWCLGESFSQANTELVPNLSCAEQTNWGHEFTGTACAVSSPDQSHQDSGLSTSDAVTPQQQIIQQNDFLYQQRFLQWQQQLYHQQQQQLLQFQQQQQQQQQQQLLQLQQQQQQQQQELVQQPFQQQLEQPLMEANIDTLPQPIRSPYEWLNSHSQPSTGKTRTKDKYRIVYSDRQRSQLENEFNCNEYITVKRKAELSKLIGLSERQIKIWFQNRRAKKRKQSSKEEELIQQLIII